MPEIRESVKGKCAADFKDYEVRFWCVCVCERFCLCGCVGFGLGWVGWWAGCGVGVGDGGKERDVGTMVARCVTRRGGGNSAPYLPTYTTTTTTTGLRGAHPGPRRGRDVRAAVHGVAQVHRQIRA